MKKVFSILLALVLCLGLVSVSAEGKVNLVVWESTNGPDQWIQKAGEAFTALHPNITIEYVNVELGDSSGQIALDGPAGIGPDLFAAPHDKLGELVSGGHVAQVPNPDEIKALVLGGCANAVTYDGVMYGYPTSSETYALYYNKDIVPTPPATWEELVKFCESYNAANPGKYGFMMDVTSAYYTILFTTSGANRLFGESGTDVTSTYLNSEEAIKGMTFFQSLRKILDAPSADLTTALCDAAFKDGTAAMHISGPWNITPFTEAKVNFGVAAIPALPGETTPPATFSGTRGMFISAYSEHQTEAAQFAQFLLTPEMQSLRFDITGAMPSTSIKVESPYMEGFLAQMQYAFPMPSIPQMGKFWDATGAASQNIWNGSDVKTELDAANAAILAQ